MEELKKLQLDDLSQFTIKGSETEWSSALSKNPKGIVSLKRYYFIYVMSECVVKSFFFLFKWREKATPRCWRGESRRGREARKEEESQQESKRQEKGQEVISSLFHNAGCRFRETNIRLWHTNIGSLFVMTVSFMAKANLRKCDMKIWVFRRLRHYEQWIQIK